MYPQNHAQGSAIQMIEKDVSVPYISNRSPITFSLIDQMNLTPNNVYDSEYLNPLEIDSHDDLYNQRVFELLDQGRYKELMLYAIIEDDVQILIAVLNRIDYEREYNASLWDNSIELSYDTNEIFRLAYEGNAEMIMFYLMDNHIKPLELHELFKEINMMNENVINRFLNRIRFNKQLRKAISKYEISTWLLNADNKLIVPTNEIGMYLDLLIRTLIMKGDIKINKLGNMQDIWLFFYDS
ncbi:hypothetical protein D3C87_759790 [compost metagenome]